MSDSNGSTTDNNEQTSAESPAEGEEQTPDEGAKPDEGKEPKDAEPKPGEGEDEDSTLDLDGAKKALSKVRQEAAKSRTRLRELEAQLKDAKTPEQVQTIVDELTSSNATETRALLVENVALKAGLSEEFHDRLKGETREELEADAKSLAKLVGAGSKADPDVDGGLSPKGGEPATYDREAALKRVREIRRGRGGR